MCFTLSEHGVPGGTQPSQQVKAAQRNRDAGDAGGHGPIDPPRSAAAALRIFSFPLTPCL